MKRAIWVLAVLPFSLCSCGLYQAVRDEDSTQGYSFLGLNPVSAITGVSDTTAENFKPFSYYSDLVQTRNEGAMTPDRAKDVLAAMDRCFGDKAVKKMTEGKIISLFGPPDEKTTQSGWVVYIYRIQGGKYGERWLVMN